MIYQQGAIFYPNFVEPATYIGSVNMYVKRASDNYFLDWNDSTFKNIGWTTKGKSLSEISIDGKSVWTYITGWTIPASNETYHVYYKDDSGEHYQGETIQVGNLTNFATAAALATVDSNVDAIKTKTDNLPDGIKKNTALSNFPFFMVDSSDDISGKTGLTVTATRSIDGAAFAACTNSPTEISGGAYKINLSAADLNGDTVMLKFSGTGANDTLLTLITQS